MDYRELGSTGLSLSVLGFGCGATGGLFVRGEADAQKAAVALALEHGVNYFDTAAQYGEGKSEVNLGRALKSLGATPYLGTKIRLEREELRELATVVPAKLALGLERLGVSRVDIVTLHNRVGREDRALRASEIVGPVADAMRGLVAKGLAGAIGFTGLGESDELLEVAASGRFDSFQCYYNVLNQSAAIAGSPDGLTQDFGGLLEVAVSNGLGALCIRSLAGGALGGGPTPHHLAGPQDWPMVKGGEYREDIRRGAMLLGRLGEFGVSSLPELAYRFAFSEPRFSSVIGGFSDSRHLEEALEAEALGSLAPGAVASLRELASSRNPWG